MQHRRLVYNTALLTLSSLLMSGIGMAFQVWLAARIGTSGIGLYQLTLSVTNLGATFAISGIRFATTRLVAEELGRDKPSGIQAAMRRCLAYAAFFGVAALLILYFLAEPLACLGIRDARTIFSLQLAAFSMPCIALCSAMSGYFTACGRVWKPTAVHLLEQLSGVLLVAWALDRVGVGDIERSCSAVTFGRLAADLLSLLLMSLVYRIDRRHHFEAEPNAGRLTGPACLRLFRRPGALRLRRAAGHGAAGAVLSLLSAGLAGGVDRPRAHGSPDAGRSPRHPPSGAEAFEGFVGLFSLGILVSFSMRPAAGLLSLSKQPGR